VIAAAAVVAIVVAGVALGAARGKLSFVGTKTQGVGGVDGISTPDDVAVSRDGRSVYAVGGGDNGLATFKRALRSGKLRFVNAKFDGQGGVDGLEDPVDVAVSRDGKNVYVTGVTDGAIATFKRNRRTSKLKFVNAKFDGVGGVTGLDNAYALVVSPDDRNVYVTDDSPVGQVVTFRRNRRTGKLRFVNAKVQGIGGVEGLNNPEGIAASADGRNVYVAGTDDDALVTFKRDRRGRLHFVNAKFDDQGGVDGLGGAYEPIVSSDGKNVYVAAQDDGGVATFKRSRRNGKLRFVNAKLSSTGLSLVHADDIVVSSDGRNVYVAAYRGGINSALVTFRRSLRSGKLRFVNAIADEVGGISGISGLWRVAISADDRNLYTANYDDSSIGIFRRHR
jgi:6-phosphogluconolactonase (cycloisomerase 2 family)